MKVCFRPLRQFSTEKAPSVARPLSRRDSAKAQAEKDYENWHKEILPNLTNSPGFYWLGGNRPFPHNKGYFPWPVLPNSIKKSLIEDMDKGVIPGILSARYKVSTERIMAIAKLAQLETYQIEKGGSLEYDYASRMDSVMYSKAQNEVAFAPSKACPMPIFKIVPDGFPLAPSVPPGDKPSDAGSTGVQITTLAEKTWFFIDTSTTEKTIWSYKRGCHSKVQDPQARQHVLKKAGVGSFKKHQL